MYQFNWSWITWKPAKGTISILQAMVSDQVIGILLGFSTIFFFKIEMQILSYWTSRQHTHIKFCENRSFYVYHLSLSSKFEISGFQLNILLWILGILKIIKSYLALELKKIVWTNRE